MPFSITTARPIPSSRAQWPARRRRETTPSAGSRATQQRRRETMFSLITGRGEAAFKSTLRRGCKENITRDHRLQRGHRFRRSRTTLVGPCEALLLAPHSKFAAHLNHFAVPHVNFKIL